jgi:hypothetical protein
VVAYIMRRVGPSMGNGFKFLPNGAVRIVFVKTAVNTTHIMGIKN